MKRTLIIAEAGVNHNGDIEIAKALIDAAADAGVDFVKFQTFKAEHLVSRKAPKAEYQIENTNDKSESQFEMIKKLELDHETHILLKKYCEEKYIKFLSTAFDMESIEFLNELGIDLFKIPSGEITNWPYLNRVGGLNKPVILSTGMSTLAEVGEAIEVLRDAGKTLHDITVLHCNTEYPTPMQDVNLRAMQTIKDTYGVQIGYSDHTLGIEVPTAAVAMGAVCIEKHFTLDRNMVGPDHRASLEPDELKQMVKAIRNIEIALGRKEKEPTQSERKNIQIGRKSIHLSRDLPKGHIIKFDDLIMLRPGDGISPMDHKRVVGKQTTSIMSSFQKLSFDHLK